MNSAEIKIDLFRKLDGLKGKDLKEAYGLLLNYINGNNDINEWNDLTHEQKEAILVGIKQLDNGEGRSHKEVMTDFRNRFLDA